MNILITASLGFNFTGSYKIRVYQKATNKKLTSSFILFRFVLTGHGNTQFHYFYISYRFYIPQPSVETPPYMTNPLIFFQNLPLSKFIDNITPINCGMNTKIKS